MLDFITLVLSVLVIFGIIYELFLLFKILEFSYCVCLSHQPPFVPSNKIARRYITDEIKKHYNSAKNICEIGSGYGGLARCVARATTANVYALENMPFTVGVSKFLDRISRCHNVKTVWCDGFEFLDKTDIEFDVVIAYLGPDKTSDLYKYKNKIHVLISLGFEIPNLKPVHIIDTHSGNVFYKRKKYPLKVFVYEFK